MRRFDGYALWKSILLRRPLAQTSRRPAHARAVPHLAGPAPPLAHAAHVRAHGYDVNPYEEEARAAVAATRAGGKAQLPLAEAYAPGRKCSARWRRTYRASRRRRSSSVALELGHIQLHVPLRCHGRARCSALTRRQRDGDVSLTSLSCPKCRRRRPPAPWAGRRILQVEEAYPRAPVAARRPRVAHCWLEGRQDRAERVGGVATDEVVAEGLEHPGVRCLQPDPVSRDEGAADRRDACVEGRGEPAAGVVAEHHVRENDIRTGVLHIDAVVAVAAPRSSRRPRTWSPVGSGSRPGRSARRPSGRWIPGR